MAKVNCKVVLHKLSFPLIKIHFPSPSNLFFCMLPISNPLILKFSLSLISRFLSPPPSSLWCKLMHFLLTIRNLSSLFTHSHTQKYTHTLTHTMCILYVVAWLAGQLMIVCVHPAAPACPSFLLPFCPSACPSVCLCPSRPASVSLFVRRRVVDICRQKVATRYRLVGGWVSRRVVSSCSWAGQLISNLSFLSVQTLQQNKHKPLEEVTSAPRCCRRSVS